MFIATKYLFISSIYLPSMNIHSYTLVSYVCINIYKQIIVYIYTTCVQMYTCICVYYLYI